MVVYRVSAFKLEAESRLNGEAAVIRYFIMVIMGMTITVGDYMAHATINGLKTTIALMQVKHTKVVMKTKRRERGKRLVAAVPVVGAEAAAWFTQVECEEWKVENPDGSFEQYSSEMKEVTIEIVDDYCNEDDSICNHIKSYLSQNV